MKRTLLFFLSAGLILGQNTAKFPGAVPTVADLGVASNRAETTLTTGINASVTSIPVASSSGFKAGTFATIDNEIIHVCAVPDGTHLTAGISACPDVDGRGTDTANGGGAAASHLAAAKVQGRIVAWNQNQAAAETVAMAKRVFGTPVNLVEYGGVCDGTTDDKDAIAAAITDLVSKGGGSLLIPGGTTCLYSAPLDLTHSQNITIMAVGSASNNARATELRYTGTASPAIDLSASNGFRFQGLSLTYSNPSFTGVLIRHALADGASSVKGVFEDSYFGGTANNIRGAAALLDFDNTTLVRVDGVTFTNAHLGIRVRTFSSAVTVKSSVFINLTDCGIDILGEGWTIDSNAFEATTITASPGNACGITHQAGAPFTGTISNNWFGDTSSVATGNWIDVYGWGINITGNKIYLDGTVSGIAVTEDNSDGMFIWGNSFYVASGTPKPINFNTTISYNVCLFANQLGAASTLTYGWVPSCATQNGITANGFLRSTGLTTMDTTATIGPTFSNFIDPVLTLNVTGHPFLLGNTTNSVGILFGHSLGNRIQGRTGATFNGNGDLWINESGGDVNVGPGPAYAYRLNVTSSGASGTARFWDQTATTGSTYVNIGLGAAQTSASITLDNGGVTKSAAFQAGTLLGVSVTKVVKGSDGNNCNLVYTGGLLTSTTCP